MSTALLGEYLQDALQCNADKSQNLTQPSKMPAGLLHDSHHLLLTITKAFDNKIVIPWSIRDYSQQLTPFQNVGTPIAEARLRKMFPPLTCLDGVPQMRITKPSVIVNQDGIIIVWYLPGALTLRRQKALHDEVLVLNSAMARMLTQTSNSGCCARMKMFHNPTTSNVSTGELSMSPAWTAVGHPKTMTSSPILRKKSGREFLQKSHASLVLLGSALWLLHPKLARRGCEIMVKINDGSVGLASVEKLRAAGTSKLWPSPFTAISIIGNKSSPLHRDGKGVASFFDVLTTLGNYNDGNIHIPALGLAFEYNPGTMVALCGKVLAHEVGPVNGERICIVQYFYKRPLDMHAQNPQLRDQQFGGWMDLETFEEVRDYGHLYDLGRVNITDPETFDEDVRDESEVGGYDLDSGDESDYQESV